MEFVSPMLFRQVSAAERAVISKCRNSELKCTKMYLAVGLCLDLLGELQYTLDSLAVMQTAKAARKGREV